MQVRPFQITDADEVIALWHRAGISRPSNDPPKDIERKLLDRPDLFLGAEMDGRVVGKVMAGYDGHRGWIYSLAVDPDHQRRGFGRALMAEAERLLREAGCPKINLQVRTSNLGAVEFYQ